MIEVRTCKIDEIVAAPNYHDVIAEYAAESAVPELGPANPQLDMYRLLESNGTMHPIGSFEDRRLLGFILPIVSVIPHYSVKIASAESFFVVKSERKRGIGLQLLEKAKAVAVEFGAKTFMLSAAIDCDLQRVLGSLKSFRNSHQVFVTVLP